MLFLPMPLSLNVHSGLNGANDSSESESGGRHTNFIGYKVTVGHVTNQVLKVYFSFIDKLLGRS